MEETNLKIDIPKVCTKLAEDYVSTITQRRAAGMEKEKWFDQWLLEELDNGRDMYETFGNLTAINPSVAKMYSEENFLALAQKIEENTELICQLEYLHRNIPISDTKNVDLKLIMQSLIYRSSFVQSPLYSPHKEVHFKSDTPLYVLGYMAYCPPDSQFLIICRKTTVTIGNLFCELCKEAGILVMISLYPEDDMQVSEVLCETPEGCVGVLSACSDVDSAVDAFVAASARTVAPYPWRLRWLLVQESAMERFTRALESRPPAERRAFALEHGGELPPGAVPVEAYRTTREALALVAARAPFAVAAFAADAAEANEVAFAARVPLVWINGHGAFGGPPLGAAAVYLREARRPAGLPDRARWLALAPATRRTRLCEALHKFSDYDPQYDSVLDISCDSAVAVDGRLWIATKTLVDFLVINPRQYILHVNAAYPDPTQSDNASNKSSISESNAVMSFTQVLNYLLAGGAVLMDSWGSSDADRLKALVALLSEVGAPVAWVSEKTSKNYPPTYTTYTVKTISSTIGTIFAN